MQFNVSQLYFNGLLNFSHFLNYQYFYMNQIIHFGLIKITIQMLHITFTSIY
jgi:hypothetical protein